jgi:hypothetical protein
VAHLLVGENLHREGRHRAGVAEDAPVAGLLRDDAADVGLAVGVARDGEVVVWRDGGSRWTPESRARLARLKAWREAEAAALGMSAGLVWSARHLDQVALRPEVEPESLDLGLERDGAPWIRRWQWQVLGERFRTLLADMRDHLG